MEALIYKDISTDSRERGSGQQTKDVQSDEDDSIEKASITDYSKLEQSVNTPQLSQQAKLPMPCNGALEHRENIMVIASQQFFDFLKELNFLKSLSYFSFSL